MSLEKLTDSKNASSRRRYEDACGTAHALDLIGERWALLVMRELMLGPKRFGDIRADLPGISANVLTQRLEGLEADTGAKITQIRSMGGGNRSTLWRQIMTDAMGVPITACAEDEISALGAAVAAMSVTGVHGPADIAVYAEKMARFTDTTEPNQENYELYGEVAEIQRKLFPALQGVNHDINEFMKRHPD